MPVHYVKVLPFGSVRDVVAGLAIGGGARIWVGEHSFPKLELRDRV